MFTCNVKTDRKAKRLLQYQIVTAEEVLQEYGCIMREALETGNREKYLLYDDKSYDLACAIHHVKNGTACSFEMELFLDIAGRDF